MLVEAGLTPMQALKAATSWSAELLAGKNGARGNPRVGSIKAGNFADLVVVGADPLVNISNTKRIERVMKAGRWIELGYHPEYYSFTTPARSIAGSVFAPVISAISPSFVAGRLGSDPRRARGQRLYHHLARPDRRRVGQDDLPRSQARRVRSAGAPRRTGDAQSLRRARARAEYRRPRLPRALGAGLQSTA